MSSWNANISTIFSSTRLRQDLSNPAEDWTGRTNPALRRKLQNRLNQRAWRRRQAAQLKLKSNEKPPFLNLRPEAEGASQDGTGTPEDLEPWSSAHASFCEMGAVGAAQILEHLDKIARQGLMLGSPRTDMLLTVIRFNIFRALIENMHSLGFNLDWLEHDALSPFCHLKDAAQSGMLPSPVSLSPTLLQRTVEHHPWIDLFPLPQMRDNILRTGVSYDDGPLCQVLVDDRRCLGAWSGLIVWGDPWDTYSWEVSEEFARDWFWVIRGCWELFKSTNVWRTRRGERKLFPDDLCSPPAV
ncbi:hypothetical protein GE09DRAFT_1041313 [Coniochaeta sp. 2T2.1]|nr:hypothetical protein GE09DRAFT_1041313 [Coniochaeta sp. 2T2.1]